MATLSAALAAKTVEHGGVSKGGVSPFGAGFEGAQPLATFRHFRGRKDGLGRILRAHGSPGYANKQFRTAPDASGEWAGQERVGRGKPLVWCVNTAKIRVAYIGCLYARGWQYIRVPLC